MDATDDAASETCTLGFESGQTSPPTQFVVLMLLLACLVAYMNSLGGEFVFDDELLVQKNPVVKNPRLWPTLFGIGADHIGYRPVRTLSYVLDAAIGGQRPWIFHLSNVLYHVAVASLVYVLAAALVGPGAAAFLGALIFALHPLHTEAVAYISGRRDLLSTLLFLGALLCFITARRRAASGERPAGPWLGSMAVLWLLALFSKEMAVTLPAVCLLYDVWRGGSRPDARRVGCYVAFFGAALLYSIYAVSPGSGVTLAPRPHAPTHGAMLATMARVFAHGLWLWIWPARLLADYSKDAFPVSASLADPVGLAALGLHASLLLWGIGEFRRGTVPGLCVLAFYVTLAPISQVVAHSELTSEHSLYLPTVFLAIPSGMALAALRRRRRSIGDGVIIVIVAGMTVRTVIRNHDWTDSMTLYLATAHVAPRCARAQTNLALALASVGERARAVDAYEQALAVDPIDPYALNNYASLLMELGRPDEAQQRLKLALRIFPAYAEAWNNLGALLRQSGALAESEAALLQALKIDPKYVHAYVNLGLTLRARGKLELAQETDLRALALDPGSIEATNNLAVVLIDRGRAKDAEIALDAALEAAPEDPVLHFNHARALRAAGRAAQAVGELRALIGQPIDQAMVRVELARAYRDVGMKEKASEQEAKARRLGGRL